MPRTKQRIAKSQFRSALTNGTALFLDKVDQRQIVARRYRDVVGLLVADMGGIDALSEAEMIIAKRAATLVVFCESQESAMASGKKLDMESYLPAVNALRRLLETIGIKRRPKVIDGRSSLDGYVTANAAPARKRKVRTARAIDAKPRRVDASIAAVANGPKH